MTTRKKLDGRIKTLIENGINTNHRSIFAIVGDKGRDQIPILYHIMAKCCVKPNPNVLWAYKKELGFSSNRKKRLRRATKKFRSRVKDVNDSNPFEMFTVSTKIRYCYYKEVQNIMGQTYSMCILQDFEALTPNILAQTIETVEGGGLVILLLSSIKSLKQLCVMKMDAHARYREGSNDDVVGRFNERFILALAGCPNHLVLNDSLEVMPISKVAPSIEPLPPKAKGLKNSEEDIALKELIGALMDGTETALAGTLVSCCATFDQGKAVLKMIDALADLTVNSTVVMTAGRGRGKSAALGLVMAAAIAYGYRNIYVTSPSPENLKTLFEYVKSGLVALKYEKNREYKFILSDEKDLRNVVVKVEIDRDGYHQTIEYVNPKDHERVIRADLVCIDEAAAIPTAHVKKFFGSHHVFMSTTVDGYEGTGSTLTTRFLDILKQRCKRREKGIALEKLLQRLRVKSKRISSRDREETLYEIDLHCPIRYSDEDPVEKWLKTLLCLNVRRPKPATDLPLPESCRLFQVNRDTLFSFQKETERFLQNLVSMFVSSHYKYSPNDIQMLSDAPNHHVFCLLGPNDKNTMEILCAVQIALEGEISREAVNNALRRGLRENIDSISWTVDGQFPHLGFNRLSGARVVTIATHPDLQRKGYGTRTMELLIKHLEGELEIGNAGGDEEMMTSSVVNIDPSTIIGEKGIKLDAKLPPLFTAADKARIGRLDYISVCYDASYPLARFFKNKSNMVPVYVDIDMNLLTEEHNCIMLRRLNNQINSNDDAEPEAKDEVDWLSKMFAAFRRTFVMSLNMECRGMDSSTAHVLLKNKNVVDTTPASEEVKEHLELLFTDYNLQLLSEFATNKIDHSQMSDVVKKLAKIALDKKIDVPLDAFQSTVLLARGLQKKLAENFCRELEAIGISMEAKACEGALDLALKSIIKKLNTTLKRDAKLVEAKSPSQNVKQMEAQVKKTLKRKADEEDGKEKKMKL